MAGHNRHWKHVTMREISVTTLLKWSLQTSHAYYNAREEKLALQWHRQKQGANYIADSESLQTRLQITLRKELGANYIADSKSLQTRCDYIALVNIAERDSILQCSRRNGEYYNSWVAITDLAFYNATKKRGT